MDETKASVEKLVGHKLTSYLPHHAFVIVATTEVAAAVAELPGVGWVGYHRPEYRVEEKTLNTLRARSAESEPHVLRVHLAKPVTRGELPELNRELVADGVLSVLDGLRSKVSTRSREHFAVHKHSLHALRVQVPAGVSVDAVQLLAEHPLVSWIEERPKLELRNLASKALTQKYSPVNTNFWPLYGDNQVIGVADSGLDMSSCFFRDASFLPPYDTTNLAHRKVVQYLRPAAMSGNADYLRDLPSGHGTHVSGSAGGSDLSGTNVYNGAAKNAKIAFFDWGNDAGELYSDVAFDTDFLETSYTAAGARIHSDSWGTDSMGMPTSIDNEADSFIHEHRDMLVLVAAGNSGATYDTDANEFHHYATTGSPATFKNGLGVGASVTTVNENSLAISLSRVRFGVGTSSIAALRTSIGLRGGVSVSGTVRTGVCTAPGRGGSDRIVVMNQNGGCSFGQQINSALSAGYSVVLLGSDVYGDILAQTSGPLAIHIVMAPISNANAVAGASGSITMQDYVGSSITSDNPEYDYAALASFSSHGPTADFRFQPLVVATGAEILSAYSNGGDPTQQCDVIGMSGTSMATPTLASNAAIVRQYYVEGYYPTGAAVPGDAIASPSAALLKATIINSAQPMTGVVNPTGTLDCTNQPSNPCPLLSAYSRLQSRYMYGFGRVQLDQTLYFPSGPGRRLFVLDESTLRTVSTSTFQSHCINADTSSEVRITLVWTDPPADDAALIRLVNNLDLVVVDNTGKAYVGNQFDPTSNDGVTMLLPDSSNNVEHVALTLASAGKITIQVIGKHVPVGPQNYALVVSGGNPTDSTGCTGTCPNGCSGHGTCANAICTCEVGFVGADCAIAAVRLTPGVAVSGTVATDGYQHYYIVPENANLDITVIVSNVIAGSYPVVIGKTGSTPTFNDFTDAANLALTNAFYARKTNIEPNKPYYIAFFGNYTVDGLPDTTSASRYSLVGEFKDAPNAAGALAPSILAAVLLSLALALAL